MNTKTGLFLGLGLLVIGNGFFKPNISTLLVNYIVTTILVVIVPSIFYMGINLGALIAPFICGYFADYRYGFLTACIGMIIGQIAFNLLAPRYLGSAGTTVVGKNLKNKMQKAVEKNL